MVEYYRVYRPNIYVYMALLLVVLTVSYAVYLISNSTFQQTRQHLEFYTTDLVSNQPLNPDLTQIVQIDGVKWDKGMTATFLAQAVSAQNGLYFKQPASGNIVRLKTFDVNTYCQLTVLQGQLFANAQLLVVGPTQNVEEYVTVNPENTEQVHVTVDNLVVNGDAVANSMLILNNLNGSNLDDNYAVIANTASNWSNVTEVEVEQLTNMGNVTIDSGAWDNVGNLDQAVGPTDTVAFTSFKSASLFATFPSTVEFFQSSGTYDWSGLSPVAVMVEVQGAGGGGGGYGSSRKAGGGGGSGSLIRIWFTASDISGQTGLDYVVGTGGSGGFGNGSSGTNSTISWRSGSLIATAFAGGGGNVGNSNGARGGSPGATPTFDSTTYNHLIVPGRVGSNGFDNIQSVSIWPGGDGGASFYGYGGKGAMLSTGLTGIFGSGGGGGSFIQGGNTRAGGPGGTGFVRIWIYT